MRFKWIIITLVAILAIAGALALKEYLLLKQIQATFMTNAPKHGKRFESEPAAPAAAAVPLVDNVRISRAGTLIEARANFSALKKMIERNPEIIRNWGRLGWKVLPMAAGDIPALCFRALHQGNPLAALGTRPGECIITLDGETVNQPVRNLGIWMTLGNRERIDVEALRDGRMISYRLRRR